MARWDIIAKEKFSNDTVEFSVYLYKSGIKIIYEDKVYYPDKVINKKNVQFDMSFGTVGVFPHGAAKPNVSIKGNEYKVFVKMSMSRKILLISCIIFLFCIGSILMFL